MPALQVREFPAGLYEELREFAAANHRSMAQQTVYAVDAMIHGAGQGQSDAGGGDSFGGFGLAGNACGGAALPLWGPAKREERIARKQAILERARSWRSRQGASIPEPMEFLEEARAERERQSDELVELVIGGAR